MLNTKKAPIAVAVLLVSAPSLGLANGYPVLQKYMEQSFAASLLLTDSDVFTVGIKDFDPNEWFNLSNDDIGSEQSLSLRQQIAVTTVPLTFDLDERADHQLFTRFSIFASTRDYQIRRQDREDYQEEYILGGLIAYRYNMKLDEKWTLTPGIGVHLQYYSNEHDYKSDFSSDYIKPFLDDVLFNTDAWAVTANPHLKLKYHHDTQWGSWNFTSSVNYLYGYGFGQANYGDVGKPEGWYMANGVNLYYDLTQIERSIQTVYTSLRRIDVGADIRNPIGTSHYYEGSLGWLMTPPFKSDWIDNVGIGLSLNYGSSLKGGSIVLFFNQTD
ncbi:MAG: Solitary outer membrane autotransporter beta-barrel domain [Pseudomonadota bacterium]